MKHLFVSGGLFLFCMLAGCGSGEQGPKVYPLTGTVTYDGTPIPSATIVLKDPTGQEKSYLAKVVDGVISGESSAGEKKVEITATRVAEGKTVPTADGSGTQPATEQYIPEKFNFKSTLTATIENGPTTLKFDLQSK
ncbi:hypothetical protein [Planctomicrobium sp. SH527]|uniref:hypothetical protein n=1 Tax=Planctomicrobium sp. SH527 TaxID=3448123 RepID=UPI003F5BDF8D